MDHVGKGVIILLNIYQRTVLHAVIVMFLVLAFIVVVDIEPSRRLSGRFRNTDEETIFIDPEHLTEYNEYSTDSSDSMTGTCYS